MKLSIAVEGVGARLGQRGAAQLASIAEAARAAAERARARTAPASAGGSVPSQDAESNASVKAGGLSRSQTE